MNTDATFTADVTFTNDAHWLIKGQTGVGNDNADSATLFIQRGTTIFGQEGDDFLVVRRGSQIQAVGTATLPITFTSEEDVTGQETGIGQWGGLVLLGNAPTNLCNTGDDGTTSDEELANCGVPGEGDSGLYGGNDPEDNSGVLRYIVVKHAGNALAAGDELNGVSLAGIGRATEVSFVQVHENLDDGIEFFGGTVNADHLVMTSIGDDSVDWSFGWTGNAQYIVVKQSEIGGDNAIEADNNEDNPGWTILTNPNISNVTIIGANETNGVRLRNGTAGSIRNLLVTGPSLYENCLRVNGDESTALAASGDLNMTHSIVACDAGNNFGGGPIGADDTETWFLAQDGNLVTTNDMLGLSSNGYTPAEGSMLLGAGTDASVLNSFFDRTDYIGAFDGVNDWTAGWVTVGLED